VACKAFIDAFPELGFLHLPTIVVWSSEITTLDVNVMQGVQPMHLLLASVTTVYASMTRGASKSPLTESTMSRIRSQVFESEISSLIHVQTLLVVSMHEWGKGHSRQAWVTCGTAIRTMQTLLTHEPSKSTHPQEWQIFNRTLWSCYIMDRMIVSRVSQPNMLTCEALHTPWPSSSANFAFGTVGANMESARSSGQLLRNMTGDILHCYDTVVRGLDIWARILKWVTSGGRRLPNLNKSENHPWVPGSPWKTFHEEIQAWRKLQERRLWFPDTSVASHAAFGQAEQFAYVNLVYHLRYVDTTALSSTFPLTRAASCSSIASTYPSYHSPALVQVARQIRRYYLQKHPAVGGTNAPASCSDPPKPFQASLVTSRLSDPHYTTCSQDFACSQLRPRICMRGRFRGWYRILVPTYPALWNETSMRSINFAMSGKLVKVGG
jgi:hypothetical protein